MQMLVYSGVKFSNGNWLKREIESIDFADLCDETNLQSTFDKASRLGNVVCVVPIDAAELAWLCAYGLPKIIEERWRKNMS